MHNKIVDQIYRRSTEKGWGALRFNFRGVGKSTGVFDAGQGETEDMLRLCRHAYGHLNLSQHPIIFLGYSFGSWILSQFLTLWEHGAHSLYFLAPPVTWYSFPVRWMNTDRAKKYVYAAEQDELIPVQKIQDWFEKLSEPKKITVIEESGHYFHTKTTLLTKQIMDEMESACRT